MSEKELKEPLLATAASEKDVEALDQPVTESARPKAAFTVNLFKLLVAFIVGYSIAITVFKKPVCAGMDMILPPPMAIEDPERISSLGEVGGYWNAIAQKGMKLAIKKERCGKVKSHKDKDHKHKHKHHEDHDDKHGKHGHHGKHRDHHGKHGKHGHGPPPFIPPRMAERIFLEVPNNDSVRAASRRYTEHAHIAGSGFDFITALNLKGEWEEALGAHVSGPEDQLFDAGSPESQSAIRDLKHDIEVWVDTYYPVMNTPVSSAVTLFTDPPFDAKLQEDIVEGDPDSVLRDEVRVFHGLSVSGDVTAKYIYAGYGRKRDFELMQEKGVDFNGKIVLVKYGGVFRGLKIKAAQEAGAIGCLIFTDPGDDGEITEANGYEQYPNGPARQPSSVQRGSVQFLSKYPGDPTTPGKPAYQNATRTEGENIPSIPSLPLSYQDALPLLLHLNGKGVKVSDYGPEWEGGLGYKGVEYWTGPSEADLRMMNEVNTRVMPIWNNMAKIPGDIQDEVIVVGNHRDAWVLGAGDPTSGTASMYEMVRGLGILLKKGWRPMRTIVLAAWDAEEYGLVGSTEWVEDFGDWLEDNAAAYLNMDESVVGPVFTAGASPSLAGLIKEVALELVSSSDRSKTIWETQESQMTWEAWRAEKGLSAFSQIEETLAEPLKVGPLGSGSDFTGFLQRYGVASGNVVFRNGPKDPVYHYHSIYDSFTWQDKFADPGFHKHADAAKILGLLTLRLADSLLIPLNTTYYSHELLNYLSKVEHIVKTTGFSDDLDLSKLKDSIDSLVSASEKLDAKAEATIQRLRDILPKPKKPKHSFWRKLAHWFKPTCDGPLPPKLIVGEVDKPEDREISPPPHHLPHHPHHHHPEHDHPSHPQPIPIPKDKLKEVEKLLGEIRRTNIARKNFEGGFISEDGIKDREWYRHKGVAPGKWLGYGATTFPALTEALTIDKSPEMAQKEADELTEMIAEMAKRLKA